MHLPSFADGRFRRRLRRRMRRDMAIAAGLIARLDWQARLALVAFAASALGLAHAYLFFVFLGLNIVEYASITDYPVFAIKGLWWVLLSILVAAVAYALPSLAAAVFTTRHRQMVRARWGRTTGRLTPAQCEAMLRQLRHRGWLSALQDGFTSAYATIMTLYFILSAVLVLGLSAYIEAERVQRLRPDSQTWTTFPSGLLHRDAVCVRLDDGKYVNRLGHAATETCQASAVSLGATSIWLIFRFGEGIKAIKRDHVRALEAVPPALHDTLSALDACRQAEDAAYDRARARHAAAGSTGPPPRRPDNCQWPEPAGGGPARAGPAPQSR